MTRIADYAFGASPKPAIIFCHISCGLQPHPPIWDIIFRIIPEIIFAIMVGMAFVAMMTRIPPPIAPSSVEIRYGLRCEIVCFIFSFLCGPGQPPSTSRSRDRNGAPGLAGQPFASMPGPVPGCQRNIVPPNKVSPNKFPPNEVPPPGCNCHRCGRTLIACCHRCP